MLEPVGNKQKTWSINQPLKCPTEEYPYIFTSKNSIKRENTSQPSTNSNSVASNSTGNYTYTTTTITLPPNGTSISNGSNQTYMNTTIAPTSNSSSKGTRGHKPHKDKTSKKSDSSFSKAKLVVIGGFLIILVMILIVGIMRRRKQITLIVDPRNIMISKGGKFNRLEESDDDYDVYTRPNTSKPEHSDKQITQTHGTRMPLD